MASAGRIYGLRVVVRYGMRRFLRDAALVSYAVCLLWVITMVKPDLIDPTHIGTDTSNYYAAGLRLDAGHALYAQGPDDRPVPIEPPYFTVPLLSPPFIAAVWRVLALLPGTPVMYAWWLGGVVLLSATVVWMAIHGSALRNLVILLLAPWLALTAWSGNVNCYLAPMLVGAWFASERGHGASSGALVAIATAIKVTPIVYLAWILARRDRPGTVGFVAAGLGCLVFSLLGAGIGAHLDYLTVIRDTGTVGVTPLSMPGILISSGLPAGLAALAIPAYAVLGVLAVVQLRHRSGPAFAAATLASVFAAPSLGYHSLPLLLPAVAPFPAGTPAPVVASTVGGLPEPT
jgi:hypothetical protein